MRLKETITMIKTNYRIEIADKQLVQEQGVKSMILKKPVLMKDKFSQMLKFEI